MIEAETSMILMTALKSGSFANPRVCLVWAYEKTDDYSISSHHGKLEICFQVI